MGERNLTVYRTKSETTETKRKRDLGQEEESTPWNHDRKRGRTMDDKKWTDDPEEKKTNVGGDRKENV